MIVSVHAPRHHTQDDRRPLAAGRANVERSFGSPEAVLHVGEARPPEPIDGVEPAAVVGDRDLRLPAVADGDVDAGRAHGRQRDCADRHGGLAEQHGGGPPRLAPALHLVLSARRSAVAAVALRFAEQAGTVINLEFITRNCDPNSL